METAKTQETVTRNRYAVKGIEKSDAPEGGDGSDWYRYTIEGTRSTITGYSRGSLREVTQKAKDFAEELNARADGRGGSTWAPRRRTK